MQNTHKRWIILIAPALFIKIFSFFPDAVEQYYSRGIYPYIADFLHLLFGWVPFSIGDIFYGVAVGYVVVKLVVFIRQLLLRQVTKKLFLQKLKKIAAFILVIYIVFNVLWGLNYNREPMAEQLGISAEKYTPGELVQLTQLLTDSINEISPSLNRDDRMFNREVIFRKALVAYSFVNRREPLLYAPYRSVKSSLLGQAMNYIGVSGYYNPFTGEAQANTSVPDFIQPFVVCHEIGHQLGYAKENEANFAGFLAAQTYPDTIFRYAAFFEMYAYARRELYRRDSVSAQTMYRQLHPRVQADFAYMKRFYEKYKNPIGPYINKIYAQYLKVNQQPEGMNTYNEVVALLIGWYEKRGLIKAK